VALDRQSIARRDFPTARRGYEPAAVDTHLAAIADEVDELRRRAGPGAVLATQTSDQVRAILEAAEASARQLRDEAGREASGHVERVEEAAKQMLGKLDGLQSELDRLLGGLRSSAEALAGSLEQLRGDAGALGGGDAPAAAEEPSAPSRNGDRSDDDAGARLVALNMALEGSPRDATARYLAEHYELADVDALLDDVYTSAGK
jgi:DivIVA domain-containing protein